MSNFPFRSSEFTPYGSLLTPKPPQDLKMQEYVQKFSKFSETCLAKGIMSAYMGGLMGFGWGLFTSILDFGPRHGIHDMHMPGGQPMPTPTFKDGLKMTWGRSYSLAKTFSGVGAAFSLTECAIERMRGKHDKLNTFSSGCIVGGGIGMRAGPQAAFFGCAGFAAFSLAIETFMEW